MNDNTKTILLENTTIDFGHLSEFILYSGAGDPRKNLKNLMNLLTI